MEQLYLYSKDEMRLFDRSTLQWTLRIGSVKPDIPETYKGLNLLDMEIEKPAEIKFYRGITGLELVDLIESGKLFSGGSQQVASDQLVENVTWLTCDMRYASGYSRDDLRRQELEKITNKDVDELRRSGAYVVVVDGQNLDFSELKKFYNDRNMVSGLKKDQIYDYILMRALGLSDVSEVIVVSEGDRKYQISNGLNENGIDVQKPIKRKKVDLSKLLTCGFALGI